VRGLFFIGLCDVYDGEEDSSWCNPSFGGGEEIALQVVTGRHEVPAAGDNFKLMLFQVGNTRLEVQMSLSGLIAQCSNCARGYVDRCHSPTMFRQPKSIATHTTGKVQGSARAQGFNRFNDEGRGGGFEVIGGAFFRTITPFPTESFHLTMIDGHDAFQYRGI
jgi:hypothetical protein